MNEKKLVSDLVQEINKTITDFVEGIPDPAVKMKVLLQCMHSWQFSELIESQLNDLMEEVKA